MKHIKLFNNESLYNSFIVSSGFIRPNVSLIEGIGIQYNPYITPTVHDYSLDYFTLEAIEDCEFTMEFGGGLQYSTDNGTTWLGDGYPKTGYDMYDDTLNQGSFETSTITAGNSIIVKCPNNIFDTWGEMGVTLEPSSANPFTITSTGKFNVKGNIMSLLYGDNFVGKNLTTDNLTYAFYYMFSNNENIVNAQDLILPTDLTNFCYTGMFSGCTSLVTAPQLPATTLSYLCYAQMFYGCTALTAAPELPATTLTKNCYQEMFDSCTSLTYIKCLATDISANQSTENWLNGVGSNGTFVKNSNMSSWTTGNDGIPSNWTVQDA